MKHIIVTISDKKQNFSFDMEVPVDLAGRRLMEDIGEVIGTYHPQIHLSELYHCLYLNRIGRVLADEESLAQAGVQRGDYITLCPKV